MLYCLFVYHFSISISLSLSIISIIIIVCGQDDARPLPGSQYSSTGGAVETGRSGLQYIIGCVTI